MSGSTSNASRRVAVIGGGITGLAATRRLVQLDPTLDVVLLEAKARLGGVLETVSTNGFLLERSADNFITNVPWGTDLCRELGIEHQLVSTSEGRRGAYVVHQGRLEKIPEGFLILAPQRLGPILSSPILSWRGKLRLLAEYFVPGKAADADHTDESLAHFATRRLGRETYERLVQPLVGGIYTADPEKLSLQATLPRFLDMERDHGSLTRALRKQARADRSTVSATSGARYHLFVAPRNGMAQLVEAIATNLPPRTIRLDSPVGRMARSAGGKWELTMAANGQSQLSVDAVIVTTPSHQAARLLADVDQQLAEHLQCIPLASCAVVSLGFRRDQIAHPLDRFGFVVPRRENRRVLSASFSSVKYPGRAPPGHELIRTFVGGALQEELVDLPDQDILSLVRSELGELLSIRGEPVLRDISRWPATMPQYHLGHCRLVRKIEERAANWDGLELAGNAYHGVGVPQCIHSGQGAAERVIQAMNSERQDGA